jgi:hypothetical protein
MLGSFTCPKVETCCWLFHFPCEGRHAEDFYIRKIQRFQPGLNPRTREPEARMLNTRSPKPSRWYVGKFLYRESSLRIAFGLAIFFLISSRPNPPGWCTLSQFTCTKAVSQIPRIDFLWRSVDHCLKIGVMKWQESVIAQQLDRQMYLIPEVSSERRI